MSIFGQVNPIYYVAGPMTGLPDNNYPAFNAVAKILCEQGYSVLNPVSNAADLPSGMSQEQIWQWFMRKAIRQLSHADRIMLLPGWENSKGACVEFGLAQSLGLRIEFWQSPEEKVARAVTSQEPKEGQVMSATKYLESLESAETGKPAQQAVALTETQIDAVYHESQGSTLREQDRVRVHSFARAILAAAQGGAK